MIKKPIIPPVELDTSDSIEGYLTDDSDSETEVARKSYGRAEVNKQDKLLDNPNGSNQDIDAPKKPEIKEVVLSVIKKEEERQLNKQIECNENKDFTLNREKSQSLQNIEEYLNVSPPNKKQFEIKEESDEESLLGLSEAETWDFSLKTIQKLNPNCKTLWVSDKDFTKKLCGMNAFNNCVHEPFKISCPCTNENKFTVCYKCHIVFCSAKCIKSTKNPVEKANTKAEIISSSDQNLPQLLNGVITKQEPLISTPAERKQVVKVTNVQPRKTTILTSNKKNTVTHDKQKNIVDALRKPDEREQEDNNWSRYRNHSSSNSSSSSQEASNIVANSSLLGAFSHSEAHEKEVPSVVPVPRKPNINSFGNRNVKSVLPQTIPNPMYPPRPFQGQYGTGLLPMPNTNMPFITPPHSYGINQTGYAAPTHMNMNPFYGNPLPRANNHHGAFNPNVPQLRNPVPLQVMRMQCGKGQIGNFPHAKVGHNGENIQPSPGIRHEARENNRAFLSDIKEVDKPQDFDSKKNPYKFNSGSSEQNFESTRIILSNIPLGSSSSTDTTSSPRVSSGSNFSTTSSILSTTTMTSHRSASVSSNTSTRGQIQERDREYLCKSSIQTQDQYGKGNASRNMDEKNPFKTQASRPPTPPERLQNNRPRPHNNPASLFHSHPENLPNVQSSSNILEKLFKDSMSVRKKIEDLPFFAYGIPSMVGYSFGDSIFELFVWTAYGYQNIAKIDEIIKQTQCFKPMTRFEPNSYCLAKYANPEDDVDGWYRARILTPLDDGKISVYFLDFGNKEILDQSVIKELPPALFNFYPSAIKLQIADFKITKILNDDDFTTFFDEFIVDKWILATICEKVSPDSNGDGVVTFKAKLEIKIEDRWINVAHKLANEDLGTIVSCDMSRIPSMHKYSSENLPLIEVSNVEIPVKVGYVNHLNEFYVIKESDIPQRDSMSKILNSTSSFEEYPITAWYGSGYVCATKREDGTWARAKITELHEKVNSVQVRFIDFGESKMVANLKELKAIPKTFLAVSQLAYKCSLPIFPTSGSWDDETDGVKVLRDIAKNQNDAEAYIVGYAVESELMIHIVEVFLKKLSKGLSKTMLNMYGDECILEYNVDLDIRKKRKSQSLSSVSVHQ